MGLYMKKQDENLFKIGEIVKILGITRKTILGYEEMELLMPAIKDENSGYRYYSADNMTQIRSIRSLQTLGLSLAEIREYYYNTENLDRHLERLMELRDTYIAAAKTGKMSMSARMFTVRMDETDTGLDLLCCIPVEEDFTGKERTEFAEVSALCIYYRGPYEGIGTAITALNEYVQTNAIETTGKFRSIYLEDPPNRGTHTSDYITQIVMPVLPCCKSL